MWKRLPAVVGLLAISLAASVQVGSASDVQASGAQLAFDRLLGGTSFVYVMSADGKRQKPLSHGFAPAWSPDGGQIALERPVSRRNVEIYATRSTGRPVRRLTRNPAIDSGAAWSPDGSLIAFASTRQGGRREVYVMDSTGTTLRGPVTGDRLADGGPTWSPDGTRIAFWGQSRTGANDLFVVDSDGSDLRRLTRTTAREGAPAWSPQGDTIAFTRAPSGGGRAQSDVWVMDLGANLRRLTRTAGYDGAPAWSPDGRRIAFVSARDGNDEIYVMNADGSGQRRLTRNRVRDGNPTWRGDR
jgi:Tol biopolymer transport system component